MQLDLNFKGTFLNFRQEWIWLIILIKRNKDLKNQRFKSVPNQAYRLSMRDIWEEKRSDKMHQKWTKKFEFHSPTSHRIVSQRAFSQIIEEANQSKGEFNRFYFEISILLILFY